MQIKPFNQLFAIPLRNGLNKPKSVRGAGTKMVNMGELFAIPRIRDIDMDRVRLSEAEIATSLLVPKDLLFARQSLVLSGAGKCSIFLGDNEEVCFESHIIRCRLDVSKAEPLFYYYLFRSFNGRRLIETIVEQGAGASGIRGSDLSNLLVPVPDIDEQRTVASILSSLDDKIELNRQINQTLEQMAQALFQCWFVDFEPVKAKVAALAEGRDPLRAAMSTLSGKTDDELDRMTPEAFDTLAATAGLFPDEMEHSALGAIPKGWHAERLGTVVELAYGKALPKTEHRFGSVPVYGSGGIGGFHDTAHVTGPGIVVGRKGTVGSVFWIDTDFCAIDTVFYVKVLEPISLYWAFEQLRRIDIASLGADSAVPGVNRNTVYMQIVVIASPELMQHYQEIVQPLITMRKEQSQQTETLAALRDSLLPKLLSGKLETAAIG